MRAQDVRWITIFVIAMLLLMSGCSITKMYPTQVVYSISSSGQIVTPQQAPIVQNPFPLATRLQIVDSPGARVDVRPTTQGNIIPAPQPYRPGQAVQPIMVVGGDDVFANVNTGGGAGWHSGQPVYGPPASAYDPRWSGGWRQPDWRDYGPGQRYIDERGRTCWNTWNRQLMCWDPRHSREPLDVMYNRTMYQSGRYYNPEPYWGRRPYYNDSYYRQPYYDPGYGQGHGHVRERRRIVVVGPLAFGNEEIDRGYRYNRGW